MSKTVDVIIPTYRPDNRFPELLRKLESGSLVPNKIIIVNTEEGLWKKSGVQSEVEAIASKCNNIEIYHISKEEFDHGNTRNLGVSKSDSDIFVMMTQDAEPKDGSLLENLVEPLLGSELEGMGQVSQEVTSEKADKAADKELGKIVAVSFARQLPRQDCNEAEKYTRGFNYPEESRIKSFDDIESLGIKTFFCSNVCAAYRREIFDKFGGFTKKTIFNEDMIFAGTVVRAGMAIAYQAKAQVIHSHNYNWLQYFHRNFDLGVSQAQYPEVFGGIRSEGEGIRLVKATAGHLKEIGCTSKIPGLVWNSGWKYLGFLLGKNYKKLPKFMVLALSDNRKFWS